LVTNFITNTMGALWNTHQEATETITDQLDPVTGKNVAQATSAVTLIGTGSGGTVSPRSCMVIGLRTALPTRAGRGRMYWPSPDDSHFTATGQYASADVTTVATGFATVLTAFKATATPVIFHRKTQTFDTITMTSVGATVGTQRRRTNKVANTYSTHTV
jgi:hypothetical protein